MTGAKIKNVPGPSSIRSAALDAAFGFGTHVMGHDSAQGEGSGLGTTDVVPCFTAVEENEDSGTAAGGAWRSLDAPQIPPLARGHPRAPASKFPAVTVVVPVGGRPAAAAPAAGGAAPAGPASVRANPGPGRPPRRTPGLSKADSEARGPGGDNGSRHVQLYSKFF